MESAATPAWVKCLAGRSTGSLQLVEPAGVRLAPCHTLKRDCSKHLCREGLFACREHLRIDRRSAKIAGRRLVVAASNEHGGRDNDNQARKHGVGRQHFSGPFAVTAIDTWHARDVRRRLAATFGNQQQIVARPIRLAWPSITARRASFHVVLGRGIEFSLMEPSCRGRSSFLAPFRIGLALTGSSPQRPSRHGLEPHWHR